MCASREHRRRDPRPAPVTSVRAQASRLSRHVSDDVRRQARVRSTEPQRAAPRARPPRSRPSRASRRGTRSRARDVRARLAAHRRAARARGVPRNAAAARGKPEHSRQCARCAASSGARGVRIRRAPLVGIAAQSIMVAILAPSSGSIAVSSPHSARSCLRAAEQARQHRGVRQTELGGDLGRGVAHEHLQHQRLAVLLRELEQGGAQLREILILRGRQHRLLPRDQLVDVDGREPLALEAARVLAPDDGQEPGLGGRFVLERIPRLPRPQHRLLHHVFRQGQVAGQPEGEAQQIRAQRLT